jgi:hypothetical protein
MLKQEEIDRLTAMNHEERHLVLRRMFIGKSKRFNEVWKFCRELEMGQKTAQTDLEYVKVTLGGKDITEVKNGEKI